MQALPGVVRLCILVLAIAATLNVMIASASPAHLHLDSSSQGRCDICFAAHTTTGDIPAAHPVCGPELEGRTQPTLPFFGYHACDGHPDCSRGPPSSL
jgi:hypothetical protein